ncbi:MAG: matrixin family metalloprotease [Methylotenera sp.]|nr:matrixin family metalloprotease [Oligoflexia bacterium]
MPLFMRAPSGTVQPISNVPSFHDTRTESSRAAPGMGLSWLQLTLATLLLTQITPFADSPCFAMTPDPADSSATRPLKSLQSSMRWKDELASFSGKKDHLTLALRYVTYSDDQGQPVLSAEQTRAIFREINQVYEVCNLHFRVEEYTVIRPDDVQLNYSPSKMSDLPSIRKAFDQPDRLLVVSTGKWNKKGGLGADGANAWSAMPGTLPSGAVMESSVANFANITAHELGHSLNLDHFSNESNLMNPIIYKRSKTLSSEQCENIRQTARTLRPEILRG